jgi:hypothetical protein
MRGTSKYSRHLDLQRATLSLRVSYRSIPLKTAPLVAFLWG